MAIEIGKIQTKETKKRRFKKHNQSKGFFSFSKKISDKTKAIIYKDLALLLQAGIDFKTALTIVKDEQKKEVAKNTINSLLLDVVKGKGLHEAMSMTSQFSTYEIFSVKIGEETRQLDSILIELQKYFDRKVKLKKQILSILTYPVFILLLTFATLYFMLTYVVPLFKSVFNQFNKELPALTKWVIALSENFNTFFTIFIAVIFVIIVLYNRVKKNERVRGVLSKIVLKIPFFGKLVKEIYLTRFCQSMALLLVSKTSLVESLGLVKKMIGFYPIEKALATVEKNVIRGQNLGDSLSNFPVFDSNLVSMVKVAEQVNQLDKMFLTLSIQYDEEVEHKTKIMGSVIEPMLILLIGGIVGVIMVSMYAPMFDLSEVIGGN